MESASLQERSFNFKFSHTGHVLGPGLNLHLKDLPCKLAGSTSGHEAIYMSLQHFNINSQGKDEWYRVQDGPGHLIAS